MYCSLRCVGYVGGCLKEWINVYVYLRILSLGLQFLIAWFLRRLPLLLIWPLSNISYISFYYATSTSLELSSPGHWNHSQFSQWSHYACFCDNSWLRADFVVWEETYSVSWIYLTSHRTFEVQRLSLDAKLIWPLQLKLWCLFDNGRGYRPGLTDVRRLEENWHYWTSFWFFTNRLVFSSPMFSIWRYNVAQGWVLCLCTLATKCREQARKACCSAPSGKRPQLPGSIRSRPLCIRDPM